MFSRTSGYADKMITEAYEVRLDPNGFNSNDRLKRRRAFILTMTLAQYLDTKGRSTENQGGRRDGHCHQTKESVSKKTKCKAVLQKSGSGESHIAAKKRVERPRGDFLEVGDTSL
jgi:hypothetical protein